MTFSLELGMYGISRLTKKTPGYDILSRDSALDVMIKAWQFNISRVDTAPGYGQGDADSLIQDCRNLGLAFQVCSKVGLNTTRNKFAANLNAILNDIDSINDAHRDFIYRVLLHSPTQEFLKDTSACEKIFASVKDKFGSATEVGISLRSPEDLHLCSSFTSNFNVVIQSNYSWIDMRLKNYLELPGFKFIARSIYGSGILAYLYNRKSEHIHNLFDASDIRSSWDLELILNKASEDVKNFLDYCDHNCSLSLDNIVASLFVHEPKIHGAVIGPTNVEELSLIASSFKKFGLIV